MAYVYGEEYEGLFLADYNIIKGLGSAFETWLKNNMHEAEGSGGSFYVFNEDITGSDLLDYFRDNNIDTEPNISWFTYLHSTWKVYDPEF